MAHDAWLPISFTIGADAHLASVITANEDWQIWSLKEGGAVLLASRSLAARWLKAGLLDERVTTEVTFGDLRLTAITVAPGRTITALAISPSPDTYNEALAFATALHDSRAVDPKSSFRNGIRKKRKFVSALPSA